jgi:hypothetical protein
MRISRNSLKSACAFFLAAGILAGGEYPAPTADEIVARMVAADDARAPKLHDYTSLRKYSLDNKRFAVHAGMTVRVTYQYPGPKHFEITEQSGPAPVRAKVFRRMLDSELKASSGQAREDTRFSPRNYAFTLVATREHEGRRCFVLKTEPKSDNPVLFRGEVYVDAEDYAVAYLDGAPAQNPSFWLRKTAIHHRYGKFGPFWLPLSNDSGSDVRMFGHTQVRIEYSEYQINKLESSPAVASGAQ